MIGAWRDMINEVECCQPLASHFLTLAYDEAEHLDALAAAQRTAVERRILAALEDDPDEGWRDWGKLEGDKGQAKAFFQRLDGDTLDAVGVVIVEGEHPGGAQFRRVVGAPSEDANAAAQDLALPFRFKAQA